MIKVLKKLFEKKKFTLGLALGGGGAKGSVHLGALRAFEEAGLEFDVVAGTSIGSLVGALYARGLNWREIDVAVSSSGLNDVKNLIVSRLTGHGVDDIIKAVCGNLDFTDLKKPFSAVAVELSSGEEKDFIEGDLVKAIGASCAIPPFFHAVTIDGKQYVDGAYRNSVPCDVAKILGADFVVGVDLSNGRDNNTHNKSYLDDMYKNNGVPLCNPAKGYEYCDYMIAPDLTKYSSTSFDALDEMFDIGYFHAKERIGDILSAIEEAKK